MYDFGFTNGPQILENNFPKLQINDARYHEVGSPQFFLTSYDVFICPCVEA